MCLSWAEDLVCCTWVLWMIAPVKGLIWLTVGLYPSYRRKTCRSRSKNAPGCMPEAPSLTVFVDFLHASPWGLVVQTFSLHVQVENLHYNSLVIPTSRACLRRRPTAQ